MPTRIRAVVISNSDLKTPVSGVTCEAYSPADGSAEGSVASDANGNVTLAGLSDKAWIVRRVSGSSSIVILPVLETWVQDDIHGQRSLPSAHSWSQIAARAHGRDDHAGNVYPGGLEPPMRIVFAYPDENLALNGVFVPRPAYDLFDHLPGSATLVEFTGTYGTAGDAASTLTLERSTDDPFTGAGSWSAVAAVAMGTSKKASTTTITAINWAADYLRVSCTALSGAAPKDAVAYLDVRVYP